MPKKELPAYYPLTLELSQKLRGANLTAAEWRFWAYLIEIDPWGERYKDLSPLTIMAECKMSKPTYYRAKGKFQELDIFDFQEEKVSFRNLMGISSLRQPQEFNSSLKNETASLKNETASLKNKTASLKNETEKSKMRQKNQKFNNESSETLPCKGSEIPQTLKTNTDFNQTNQTLSESTGERKRKFSQFLETLPEPEKTFFLDFCNHAAENAYGNKIALPDLWIASHFEELHKQYWLAVDKISGNSPPVENQAVSAEPNYFSIADLQQMYGADWKNAAAHFGIEVSDVS